MLDFLKSNKTVIFIVMGVIALIIAAYFIIQIRKRKQEEEASIEDASDMVADVVTNGDEEMKASFNGEAEKKKVMQR